jgi:hypothetical protein
MNANVNGTNGTVCFALCAGINGGLCFHFDAYLTAAAAASLLALGVVLEASLAVCELRITLACAREQQRTGAVDRARDGRATVHRKSNDG